MNMHSAHPRNDEQPASEDQLASKPVGVPAAPEGVKEDAESVSYLGVTLPKGIGGPNVPDRERFAGDTITRYDLRLMQKIALSFELDEPLLIEGGSGLGKTRAIERMCAQLNWECYYANCHDFDSDVLIGAKTVREDTRSGFGWKDGIVVQALRGMNPPEANHIRVIVLDEYNFMRGETRGRLHEILDSVLSGKNRVSLIENDGEVVRVAPGLKIVALQNPPGSRYEDREILDEAQFTRMTYQKEPTRMPTEVMLDRALGGIRQAPPILLKETDFITQTPGLARSQVSEIPGMAEVLTRFVEFYAALDEMVRKIELAEDQPQPIYFSFQRDYERVMKFVARHYNGDLNETVGRSLEYFFVNKFESEPDRAKVRELASHVGHFPEHSSRRKSVEDFVANDDTLDMSALERDREGYVERLRRLGVSEGGLAGALSGIDSDWAWKFREDLLGAGIDRNRIAEGLTGVRSERSYELRRTLLEQGADPAVVSKSLAGDDSEPAWELRRHMLRTAKKPELVIDGLAGLDSEEAWKLRWRYAVTGIRAMVENMRGMDPRYKRDHVAHSLAGLDSDEAWKMREFLSRCDISRSALAVSLAGLDSDRAWNMRERFYQESVGTDALAKSLTCLDSDRAWQMRGRWEKKGLKLAVLTSIAGLECEKAARLRTEALRDVDSREAAASSFAGSHLSAAVRSARG